VNAFFGASLVGNSCTPGTGGWYADLRGWTLMDADRSGLGVRVGEDDALPFEFWLLEVDKEGEFLA
jgi:hypothetical protein